MSSATAIPLSAELKSTWEAQRSAGDARVLRIVISNEECVLQDIPIKVASDRAKEADFNSLLAIVAPSEPCYLLFRDNGPHWIFLAFIPDNAKISDKLVYAATVATVKRLLGEGNFVDEAHMSVLSELSWSAYASSRKPVACPSDREEHIQQLDEMEAQARKEQEDDARAKAAEASAPPATQPVEAVPTPAAVSPTETKPPARQPIAPVTTPAATAKKPAATAKPTAATVKPKPPTPTPTTTTTTKPVADEMQPSGAGVSGLRRAFESGDSAQLAQHSSSYSSAAASASALDSEHGMRRDAVGGYHTVKLPFASEATVALRKIPQGAANFVELKIENEQVCLASSGTVSVGQLAARIDATEPRFIFYAFRHTRAGGCERTCTLFIYSCPDKSRPKLRMVYSTSKPNISQEAQAAGIVVARKMEIRSGEEATQQALLDALYPSASSASSYSSSPYAAARAPQTAMAAKQHAVSVPHPVFSKIAGGDSHPGGMKKKIVIPPSGAW